MPERLDLLGGQGVRSVRLGFDRHRVEHGRQHDLGGQLCQRVVRWLLQLEQRQRSDRNQQLEQRQLHGQQLWRVQQLIRFPGGRSLRP